MPKLKIVYSIISCYNIIYFYLSVILKDIIYFVVLKYVNINEHIFCKSNCQMYIHRVHRCNEDARCHDSVPNFE